MIDFEWYRSFIAVYRFGTVTGAAEARNLTQPAISQHIAALESILGFELFERAPRGMKPTEQGMVLYTKVVGSMDELEKTTLLFRQNLTAEKPILRLGTPLAYFYEVGLEKLKRPPFRLRVEINDSEEMIEHLSCGKLDAVIATQRINKTNIDYTKLYEEDFCLVSSEGIDLPKGLTKTSSKIKEVETFLLRQNWISFSSELPIIRRFWHIAFNTRPKMDSLIIIPSLLPIRKAVILGLGVSVLPKYLCQSALDMGSLKVLWQPKRVSSNTLWIATRKTDRYKQEIEQFITLMT